MTHKLSSELESCHKTHFPDFPLPAAGDSNLRSDIPLANGFPGHSQPMCKICAIVSSAVYPQRGARNGPSTKATQKTKKKSVCIAPLSLLNHLSEVWCTLTATILPALKLHRLCAMQISPKTGRGRALGGVKPLSAKSKEQKEHTLSSTRPFPHQNKICGNLQPLSL